MNGRWGPSDSRIEQGRRPLLIAMSLSATLSLVTVVRFVLLVSTMPPAEYGELNIFLTLAQVLPMVANLGLSLQFQRVARNRGASSRDRLLRLGLLVSAATTVPTLLLTGTLTLPTTGPQDFLFPAIATGVIVMASAYQSLDSQVTLGFGYRARASIMVFALNAAAIFPLIPIVITRSASLDLVLGLWAAAACVVAVLSRFWVPRKPRHPTEGDGADVSFAEGVASIPALIGPWLVIFVTRYFIALVIGTDAVAVFSVSSTVVDFGFILAASAIGFWSNRVMVGTQSPWRSFTITLPIMIAVAVMATVGVQWLLPLIGKAGYRQDLSVTAVLILSATARLYGLTWRPRAVGLGVLQRSGWIYLVMAAVIVAVALMFQPTDLVWFAVPLFVSFLVPSIVQHVNVVRATERRQRLVADETDRISAEDNSEGLA